MKHLTPISLRLGIIVALVVGLTTPFVQSALAQMQPDPPDPPLFFKGYKWSLEFDYERSLNGVATVEVAKFNSQTGQIGKMLGVYKHTVFCDSKGNVSLQQGKAIFAPNSLITCQFDLRTYLEEARKKHGFALFPNPIYPDFLIEVSQAQLYIPNISAPTSISLFKHPNIEQLVTVNAQKSTVVLSTNLETGGLKESRAFEVLNLASTELGLTIDNQCRIPDNCEVRYSVNTATGPDEQVFQGYRIPFDVSDTEIIIGQSKEIPWSTSNIFIDPRTWNGNG